MPDDHNDGGESVSRSRKKLLRQIAAVTLAGTAVLMGVNEVNDQRSSHSRAVGVEALQGRMESGEANVKPGILVVNSGARVRNTPELLKSDHEHSANVIDKVGSGKRLVITNPVEVKADDGGTSYAFTYDRDGEKQAAFVSADLLSQENSSGERYATFFESGSDSITEYNPSDLAFDSQSGELYIDGSSQKVVGLGSMMDGEQALSALISELDNAKRGQTSD